jgi:predicted RNA binding protein with dsRBD fold (UPF0201 family)
MSVEIRVQSVVNPTEDEKKVERAMRNLFPSGRMERVEEDNHCRLRLQSEGLEALTTLRNLIKQERIRSAARSILVKRTRGGRMEFCVNKQAAFVGRISFCEPVGESPNGPISIEVQTSDPESVLNFLASRELYGSIGLRHAKRAK